MKRIMISNLSFLRWSVGTRVVRARCFVPLLAVALCLTGCVVTDMASRALVGTDDPTPKQRALAYHQAQTVEGLKFYDKALTKITDDKGDNKSIIKLANLVDDELRRKGKAGEESKIAMVGNTIVRLNEYPEMKKKVEEGFEFGMNALTLALSGGVGGTGLIGALLARSRAKNKKNKKRIDYEITKNRIKTRLINTDPGMKIAVEEAARHTVADGSII